MEPISSDYLLPFDPHDPIILHGDLGNSCQKVVGYRELFIKKERIVHLKLLTDYYTREEPSDDDNPKLFRSFQDELARGGGETGKGRLFLKRNYPDRRDTLNSRNQHRSETPSAEKTQIIRLSRRRALEGQV